MATKKISFEQAMDRIDEILEILAEPGLSLEQSLKLYEEAVGLIRFCNDTLQKAKLKIEEVSLGDAGQNDPQ